MISDPEFRWLRAGYLNEYPVQQQATVVVPMFPYHEWVERLVSDKFMGRYRRVYLPFHEAVKRLGPGPERRWLRAALLWGGLPCLCHHARLTEHLAALDGVDEWRVLRAIREGSRRAAMAVERLGDLDIPRFRGKVPVGRQDARATRRISAMADTVPAQSDRRPRRKAEDLRVTTGRESAASLGDQRKWPGSSTQEVCPRRDPPDAPLCSCHGAVHGRAPKTRT